MKNKLYEEIIIGMLKTLRKLIHSAPNELLDDLERLETNTFKLDAIIGTLIDLIKDKE